MSGFDEVDNIEISSTKKFDDIIMETEQRIRECHHHKVPLDTREFEQFKKGWFYHNWYHRFARLGSVGVISIPNTTLEEFIYWLYEWSIKFTDDYNKFKKLVWEAIKLHEEHLTILDNKVKELENRVDELERQIGLIWQKINEILEQIQQIWTKIDELQNTINNLQDQINELKANNEKLNKIIQNLTNSGAWNPNTNDFYDDRNIATGNINFFGGSQDGGSFIRTNNGHTENDVTAGI